MLTAKEFCMTSDHEKLYVFCSCTAAPQRSPPICPKQFSASKLKCYLKNYSYMYETNIFKKSLNQTLNKIVLLYIIQLHYSR